jgi:hypothetical protein
MQEISLTEAWKRTKVREPDGKVGKTYLISMCVNSGKKTWHFLG